jgi:copper chaperone CopZ
VSAVWQLDGIVDVQASYADKHMTVNFNDDIVDESKILSVIENARFLVEKE